MDGLALGDPGFTVGTEVEGVLDTAAGFPTMNGGRFKGLAVVGLALGDPGVTVGNPVVGPGDEGLGDMAGVGARLGLPGVTVGAGVVVAMGLGEAVLGLALGDPGFIVGALVGL